MKTMSDILGTAIYCMLMYGLSWGLVWLVWPHLIPLTWWMAPWMPQAFALLSTVAVYVVITHMQRGKLMPTGKPFLICYLCTQLPYLLSTVHPSQYNAGGAAMEAGFTLGALQLLAVSFWRQPRLDWTKGADMSVREWFTSLGVAATTAVPAAFVVWCVWPHMMPLVTAQVAAPTATIVSLVAGFLTYGVIMHAQRGKVEVQSRAYMIPYMLVMAVQSLTTLHHTQYNVGVAVACVSYLLLYARLYYGRYIHHGGSTAAVT